MDFYTAGCTLGRVKKMRVAPCTPSVISYKTCNDARINYRIKNSRLSRFLRLTLNPIPASDS
jgi:hypothetical protein